MTRIRIGITIWLALMLGIPAPAANRPNILFICADDWGFGDLGCHGNKVVETPHLDRLAAQGADFRQFTVASGVCSPSRTAMLTGRFPARHRINQHFASIRHHQGAGMPDWLDPAVPTLPRRLQEAGYATYHFGKWHLTSRDVTDAPHPTRYGYDETTVWNGPDPAIDPAEVFDRAIEVIRRKGGKPFFINLWIHETHTPHYPTEKWLDHYAAKGLDERTRVYPAVASRADHEIGRVLEALDQTGLSKDTLVIFTSDNGPEVPLERKPATMNHPEIGKGLNTWYSLGSSGGLKGAKRSLHEGGVRVPLLVRWPGRVEAGKVDETSVITGVDWLPTLCKLAGTTPPDGFAGDGEDRSAVLLGKPAGRVKPIYWFWPPARSGDTWAYAAIRDGNWKLLIDKEGQRVELYDVPADRGETGDLSNKHPDVVKDLRAKLDRWLSELPDEPAPQCLSELRRK